jgi:hypothetical protein
MRTVFLTIALLGLTPLLPAQRIELGYLHTFHTQATTYRQREWTRVPGTWLGPDDPNFPETFRVRETWTEKKYNVHQPMLSLFFPLGKSADDKWTAEWISGFFPNSFRELSLFSGVNGSYRIAPDWRVQMQLGIVSNYSQRQAYTLWGTIPGANLSVEWAPVKRAVVRLYGNPEMIGLGVHYLLKKS